MSSPSGLLIIDKPEGPTSMDVCSRVRARLRRAGAPKRIKVGHAGTLDPLATGVLVVLVGKATRHSDRFMAGEKRYLADIDLSTFSSTDDREGVKTPVTVAIPPTLPDVARACDRFIGTVMQTPPAYSAVKVAGERAYRLARAGKTLDLKARPVVIHAIDIRRYEWPHLAIDVRCAKGVYIRSLARDLGLALNTGGMLAALQRTRVGPFSIEDAVPLDKLPDPLAQDDLLDVDAIRPRTT